MTSALFQFHTGSDMEVITRTGLRILFEIGFLRSWYFDLLSCLQLDLVIFTVLSNLDDSTIIYMMYPCTHRVFICFSLIEFFLLILMTCLWIKRLFFLSTCETICQCILSIVQQSVLTACILPLKTFSNQCDKKAIIFFIKEYESVNLVVIKEKGENNRCQKGKNKNSSQSDVEETYFICVLIRVFVMKVVGHFP